MIMLKHNLIYKFGNRPIYSYIKNAKIVIKMLNLNLKPGPASSHAGRYYTYIILR